VLIADADKYHLLSNNCQNFAAALLRSVEPMLEHPTAFDEHVEKWNLMPEPIMTGQGETTYSSNNGREVATVGEWDDYYKTFAAKIGGDGAYEQTAYGQESRERDDRRERENRREGKIQRTKGRSRA
jgi:hypothetical protein